MNYSSVCKRIIMVFNSATGQPGRIGSVLHRHGFEFDIRRPGEGDELPRDLSGYHAAIVFGGPMSANDDDLPNIARIMAWLPHVVASDVRYLGVCLGAQLMARHLGAAVLPHPAGQTEIGYYPVYATGAGRDHFPDELVVYHWHREGFDLPPGAELLARGTVFPHQAYRVGNRIWGLQFHPEVDDEIHERWLRDAVEKTALPNAQNPDQQRAGRIRYDEALGAWFKDFARQSLLTPLDADCLSQ
ncbi:GMP synthase [Thalassospira sp.]|uniref:glutamine amidotransferase-related protein n=1 Tax=Thalassospira sp. TaxID=1912094 RepID=UPI002732F69D|nr:GMP synthase [Thalassospira sp.]MDP2697195.1 GMP synthase [Thalassospira sp.]